MLKNMPKYCIIEIVGMKEGGDMAKIKKVLSILIICIVLSITCNIIYAATEDQKVQVIIGISEYMEKNYPNIQNENLSTPENQVAITKIAAQFKALCDSAGIPVSDMEAADVDLGWQGVADNSGLFTLVIREAKNPSLGEQAKDPNKTNDEKKELADSIRQKASVGLGNMSTADLKALDTLLNQFRTTYPGSWSQTDTDYYDLYFMAIEIHDEVEKRRDEGDTEIPDDYQGTLGGQVTDRNDEQENLKDKGTLGVLGNSNVDSTLHTPDEIINEAIDFKNSGNATIPINGDNLQKGSSTLFNILLSIGFFAAVAIGMYLGVKIMLANAEEKAKTKEALIPYIAGCVIIFGAFAIWKLAITLLSGIEKVSDLPVRNEYVIARQLDEK